MGFIRTLVIGAAISYGIQYITKKREDGTSILDNFINETSDFVQSTRFLLPKRLIILLRQQKEQ